MPLSSVLGAQSLVRPGVCTSTTRPASPFAGQTIYETDTNLIRSFNGSSWVTIGPTTVPAAGMVLLTPKTTFTSTTSFSLTTDTFTASYDSYRVNLTFTSYAADSNVSCRMRKSGVDNTSNSYVWALQENRSNGFGNATGGTATSAPVCYLNSVAQYSSAAVEIRTPKTTSRTWGNFWNSASNYGDNSLYASQNGGFVLDLDDSFDSMTFIATTAVSGFYTVYGYGQ